MSGRFRLQRDSKNGTSLGDMIRLWRQELPPDAHEYAFRNSALRCQGESPDTTPKLSLRLGFETMAETAPPIGAMLIFPKSEKLSAFA